MRFCEKVALADAVNHPVTFHDADSSTPRR